MAVCGGDLFDRDCAEAVLRTGEGGCLPGEAGIVVLSSDDAHTLCCTCCPNTVTGSSCGDHSTWREDGEVDITDEGYEDLVMKGEG